MLLTITVYLPTIAQIESEAVSTYNSGLIDESATEIVTYDLKTQRVFVFNASGGNVDVLDISNQSVLTLMFTIEVSMDGGAANCFAFHNGLLAITVADKSEQVRKKPLPLKEWVHVASTYDGKDMKIF